MDSLTVVKTLAIGTIVGVAAYAGVKYGHLLDQGTTETTVAVTTKAKPVPAREILSYIPADTLFYMGGSKPASQQDIFGFIPSDEMMAQQAEIFKSADVNKMSGEPEGAKMFFGLVAEWMEVMKEPKTIFQKMGFGNELDMAIYSVGALPVVRVKLADKAAFNAFLDRSEKHAGAKPVTETLGDASYRSYAFEQEEEINAKLIVAVHGDYAVVSLFTQVESEDVRKTILGSNKPATSLASNSVVSDIEKEYQFYPAMHGFINHVEIIRGVTNAGGNEFGRMLDAVVEIANKDRPAAAQENPFKDWRTPECQKEVMVSAKSWPRTVFGYTNLNTTSKPKSMSYKMVVESKDTALLKTLKTIRGFIPPSANQLKESSLVSLGLGLNVDAVVPALNEVVTGFTQKDYKCKFYADLKQELITKNPVMMLGMGAAMAAGVHGASAAIVDMTGEVDLSNANPMPQIKSIDALVTISAKNPQTLAALAGNFAQGQAPLQIPADGTPIDFPMPLPLPPQKKVKLAIKGNHIVAYVGAKAEKAANALATIPLKANGMVTIGMDFRKYMNLILNSMKSQMATDDELAKQNQKMLDSMKDINMSFVERFDLSDKGFEVSIDMTMD